MRTRSEPTFIVTIYLAGDLAEIRRCCRAFCLEVGLCVTVTACDYLYTGGEESGAAVGLVNYPRFPTEPEVMTATARALANELIEAASQHSALIVTPTLTEWLTRRPE